MIVATIQDKRINLEDDIIYPHDKSRLEHATEAYGLMFNDYNKLYNTNYDKFFWAYSRVIDEPIELEETQLIRMQELSNIGGGIAILLDVPSTMMTLESSFYDFSDQIYYREFDRLSIPPWDNIYKLHGVLEKQIILPYIKKDWIIETLNVIDQEED